MRGVLTRREQLLRALRRFDWVSMAELETSLGVGPSSHHGCWDAMQKLVGAGFVERDTSKLSRYRITSEGLLEHARVKAQREAELLAL